MIEAKNKRCNEWGITVSDMSDWNETRRRQEERALHRALSNLIITRMWRVPYVNNTVDGMVFEIDYAATMVALDKAMELGVPQTEATRIHELLSDHCWRPLLYFPFESDCCSETWLADVVNFDAMIGSPVLAVYDVELPPGSHLTDESRTHQESDQIMGWDIRTAKGVCTLVVRNSSNGYYGGSVLSCELMDSVNSGWIQITEDYSA